MTSFNNSRLIACRDCGLLQPVASTSAAMVDDAAAALQEGYRDFLDAHDGHELAWLTRVGCESSSDRSLWDPMGTVTFTVTDGERTYLATGTRTALEEPRLYRFAPGSLSASGSAIVVDDRHLRRGLDLEFYPQALRLTKLDRFVTAVREVVGQLNPEDLPIAFDDADDPAVSVARMPEQTYQDLLARCSEIFDRAELDTVSKFLHENRREDGLLALRVRREFRALPA